VIDFSQREMVKEMSQVLPSGRIVASIDNFICSQIPSASEASFIYEYVDGVLVVKLVNIYSKESERPIAGRDDLHPEGVVKLEQYLSSNLGAFVAEDFVVNFELDGYGKIGVALRNSDDRIDRTVRFQQPTESQEQYVNYDAEGNLVR